MSHNVYFTTLSPASENDITPTPKPGAAPEWQEMARRADSWGAEDSGSLWKTLQKKSKKTIDKGSNLRYNGSITK